MRAALGAELSPLATGEQALLRRLLARLRPGDLLLADRNFLSHGMLEDAVGAGVHVLWRAKSDVDLPALEVLADGTYRSRIADPRASRKMRRKGARAEDIPGIAVRVIEYTVESEDGSESSEAFALVTDILDPDVPSCGQAAAAYASRWQLETCFDELETSVRGGAAVVLRPKSPPMIRQEIYAMLCCYQAIRLLISDAASQESIDPRRVSFTAARDAVRRRISEPGTFSPQELDDALADLAFEITFHRNLLPWRPGRRYAWETKRSGGRYKTRKHGDSSHLMPPTTIRFWRMSVITLT